MIKYELIESERARKRDRKRGIEGDVRGIEGECLSSFGGLAIPDIKAH